MKHTISDNIWAGCFAILLHIVIIGLFVIGMDSNDTPELVAPPKVDIVQATVIDETRILEEMERQQALEDKKLKAEIDRQAKVDKQLKETQKELARKQQEYLDQQEQAKIKQQQLELKAKQEQEKIKKLEQQHKLEDQKRIKAEAARKAEEQKKKKADAARKVEEQKKKKAAAARKAEEQKKKKAEAARKAEEQKKKKAEAARKAEEKKKAEAAARKAELQQKLDAEAREAEEARILSDIEIFVLQTQQRVRRYWNRPSNIESGGLQCLLNVKLLPSGDVRSVSVIKGSGNAIFDRSAESAVYKAAPLIMPKNPKAAARVNDFNFNFKPE